MPNSAQPPPSAAAANGPPPVHFLVRLELPDRPAKEFSYDFQQTVISLGRDPSNDIQIPLTTVSRHHARIFFERGDYFLEDLGSTHGSSHNARKLKRGEKCLLRDGDRIAIMSFSIIFKMSTAASLDRQPGEDTEKLARRMVQEMLSSLGSSKVSPPALRVMNGPDEGRRLELGDDQAEVTIGRSPECDLSLNDQNISRRHCLIKRSWHGFTAQDLGSKNGVLRNGKRIEGTQMIKDGDELQIGGIKLIFIDPPSRLLEQMGGFDNETMDAASSDLPEEEMPAEEAMEGPGEEESYHEEDSSSQMEDPMPEMDVEPPGRGDGDEASEGEDNDFEAMNEQIKKVSKGGHWDVMILLFGGIFFLAAVGLIVFLFL